MTCTLIKNTKTIVLQNNKKHKEYLKHKTLKTHNDIVVDRGLKIVVEWAKATWEKETWSYLAITKLNEPIIVKFKFNNIYYYNKYI